jgi:APA family basic amino acid/polyamine antiporter
MLLLAALASVFVLLGSFQQIVAFFLCTTLTFIALAAASLFVVRRTGARASFLVPGYPLAPALFVLLVVIVVALVAMARPVQALAGFGLVLLGLPARYLTTSRSRG